MKRPRLTYVEGYASGLEHAFCVDLQGNVVDPTLRTDSPLEEEYFGIAFKTEWVKDPILNYYVRTGKWYYGVIFNLVLDNPALSTEPDEMLDPRWYKAKK